MTGSLTSRPWARLVLAFMLGLAWVAPTRAQEKEKPTERREHTVKHGETLWDLARVYMNNPYLWPLIYEANRNVVENPHRIFPKERLVIPPLPGEKPAQPQPVAAAGPVIPAALSTRRTRFYSPPETATVATLISAEQTRLRRVEPYEYYATPWLSEPTVLSLLGSIFKSADPRVAPDKLPTTFHPYDYLYISYNGKARPKQGDLLLVVSVGREVEGYGRVIEPTGVVRVESLNTSAMLGMVTHEFGQMQTGDLVIPMDSFPELDRDPVPANGPDGTIVGFEVPQPLYGVTDRAFVSLGANSGVKVGDELVALLPDRRPTRSRSEVLPAQTIARLLVTRVAGAAATARIIYLEMPVLEKGLAVRVVARMP